ncbi:MAG: hypothetical protein ACRENO_00225, partial [Thermodesulfobacteriota bacterium]
MGTIKSIKHYNETIENEFYKEITLAAHKGLKFVPFLQVIIDQICKSENFDLGHIFSIRKNSDELY